MNARAIVMMVLTAGVLAAGAKTQSIQQSSIPNDADIRNILAERIDTMHRSVGIVVGVIDPQGRHIITYGHMDNGDSRPLDGDTLFEIGSVTKVFTSLLLSDMVQRGEVALSDPVAKYLPSSVKVPHRNGRVITLIDLSTHTSGLPRMPTNFAPKDLNNPYADYTPDQLYEFLSGYTLTRDIGSQYEYSNLGGGLLGFVLARRAGTDYEQLVRSRICEPLGMSSTTVTLTPELKARLATGHDPQLKATPNWDLSNALAGAGGLRSSANDMLKFLAANLGYIKTPLAPAMAAMLDVQRPTGTPNLAIALGWHILTVDDKQIVWHNGGTGGYRSFVGFDQKSRVGVVVLSNSAVQEGVDDIGRHLLDTKAPLMRPPSAHTEVHIDPKAFDAYVGVYRLTPTFAIRVTRDGDHFITQATGQGQVEIFPEGDHDFFAKVVDAQITFVTDNQGRATELILHQGGFDQHAPRVEGSDAAMAPKEYKAVAVDPKIFDGYVGKYQLVPGFVLTITRDDDHLFAQATNQPQAEIFPLSDKDFFLKVVDAQITFVTDGTGRATELILHQGGMDQHGKRIE